KPLMRYRPSSDLMWMSSITLGGKMKLLPKRCVSRDSGFLFFFGAGLPAGFGAVLISFAAAEDLASLVLLPVDFRAGVFFEFAMMLSFRSPDYRISFFSAGSRLS